MRRVVRMDSFNHTRSKTMNTLNAASIVIADVHPLIRAGMASLI